MSIRRLIYIPAVTLLAAFLVSAVVSCDVATDANIETTEAVAKTEITEAVATDDQVMDETSVEILFVQYAESVTLSDGVLTLKGITPETLYFSDRPHRVVGRVSTQKFVQAWDVGEESFSETPPNAVLAVMHKPVPLDLVVVLKDPVLEGDTLTYQVEVLDGPDSGEGEANALFIDVIGLSLLDDARQATRRTIRHIDNRVDNYDDDYEDPDDRDAYRDGYKDGLSDDDPVDDFDDSDEQAAYSKGYEDGQGDDEHGDSYNDDFDDSDEQDAYRKGYEDGRYSDDYEDDYNDSDERDAYRDGHEDGRRDEDQRDD